VPFTDRRHAGRELAARLGHLRGDAVVLGLPRGGLPVADEVARALGAPLDVLVVRKLGVPWHPELAMGAVATGDVRVLNDDVLQMAGVPERQVEEVNDRERQEVARRERQYRGGRPPVPVEGRVAVVVDDGLATGATAAAGVRAVRERGPVSVVLAVPVAAPDTVARLERVADEVVCPRFPPGFIAVGGYYDDFSPVTDDEVRRILDDAARR
jgi:putative phosphoribosyl transferase